MKITNIAHKIKNKIRKIYKFAFHVDQDNKINYLISWGLKIF